MSGHFTFIAASYLFLIRDGKILLQRRYQTGFEDGNYGVPSGHLDGMETVREGCAREMKEEIGIDLNLDHVQIVHIMHRKKTKDERFDFFCTTNKYEGEIKNCEPHKCDDLSWFAINDLPVNTIDYVQKAIESYRRGEPYSEYGWDSRDSVTSTSVLTKNS